MTGGAQFLAVPLVLLAAKATAILLLGFGLAQALRRASAAARHLCWLAAFCSLLALPALSSSLPVWKAPLLPLIIAVPSPSASHAGNPPSAVDLPRQMREASPAPARDSGGAVWLQRVDWKTLALLTWEVGAAVIIFRTAVSLHAVRRLARSSSVIGSGVCRQVFAECVKETHLPEKYVTLRVAGSQLGMPITWGIIRPGILLPSAATQWPRHRLRMVFLHELAHVRRKDWLGLLLSRTVCALFWFHPLAWLAARRLRLESERAADDGVLAAGVLPSAYSRELLSFVRLSCATEDENRENPHTMNRSNPLRETDRALVAALPMAQPQTLETRIRSVLDHSRPRCAVSRRHVAAALAVGAITILPLASLRLGAAENPISTAAAEKLDLSTPEAAVKSFVAAMNRGDLRAASGCVLGGRTDGVTPEMEKFFRSVKPQITVGAIQAETMEHEAKVQVGAGQIVGAASDGQNPGDGTRKELLGEQTLTVRQDGGRWKVVPSAAERPEGGMMLQAMAMELSAAPGQSSPARTKAMIQVCMSKLRQLALAAFMYAEAHENQFNFPGGDAKKALLPFAGNDETLFTAPTGPEQSVSFAFNPKLLNTKQSALLEPARTVLFYEPSALPQEPSFPHNSRSAIAFADGHVELISRDQAAQLRWQP